MHPSILAICAALLSALNTAHAQLLTLKAPVLACIAPERLVCGCSIRLAGVPCTKQAFSSQPHLFTELQPNAPLLITLDGEELSIAHVSHFGTSIKGDPPGHSTDVYSSPMLKATVQYSPAASTCPKTKTDGCEFTNIRAQVSLRFRSGQVINYQGAGACGC